MRPIVAVALSLGVIAAAACSADGLESSINGSNGIGTTTTASSGTGAVGGGAHTGGEGLKAFSYSDYCGGGCLPEESDAADPCELGAGGAGGAGGGMGGGDLDCKLSYEATSPNETAGMCVAPGMQMNGGPCITSADCAADHGCVNEEGNGVCRQYCCGALEDCPLEVTFCDLRSLFDSTPSVPVCALVDDCTLLDATSCDNGKTCTIVRQDGTTSCVTPGTGMHGDPCPCAADHVCATGLNQCLRLCHTDGNDCPPEAPKCQGGATIYPPGFGVCVEN
jgi:hypothetical protein